MTSQTADDGEQEDDYTPSSADSLWAPLLALVKLDAQGTKFYSAIPVSNIVNRIGKTAHDYLTTRTEFLFGNPALLAIGLADTKGHARCTARALVAMAQQENLIGLLTAVQKYLHDGIETPMLQDKIVNDEEYTGVLRPLFRRFQTVRRIATDDRIPEDVRLIDLPFARPLLDDVVRCAKDMLISNTISEVSGKVGVKTGCTHDHRRSDDTLHRRASAVLPSRKYPSHQYIEEHLEAARKANGQNEVARRGREQDDGCDASAIGCMRTEQLGLLRPYEGDRPPCDLHWDLLDAQQRALVRSLGFDPATWVHDTWTNVPTWSALTQNGLLMGAAKVLGFSEDTWWGELVPVAAFAEASVSRDARDAERAAQAEETMTFQQLLESGMAEEEEAKEASGPEPVLPSIAPVVDYHQFEQLSTAEKRRMLLPGTVVSMAHGRTPDGHVTFYLAIIVEPKEGGSNKTGPQSVRIRWFREVDGEDDVYCLETRGTASQPWHKEVNRAIAKIMDTPRVESLPNAEDGTRRWRLLGAQADASMAKVAAPADVDTPVDVDASAKTPTVGDSQTPTPPPRALLRGPHGQRRGDVGYLSDEEREWLTDVQLYNARLLLLSVPKLRSGGNVLVKMPRSLDKVLATNDGTFFTLASIKGLLAGSKDIAVVQYCEGMHWRLLVLWGPEQVSGSEHLLVASFYSFT